MRRRWTPAEDRTLRRRYVSATAAEVARELDRSVSSVQQRVNTLGLSKPEGWAAECTRKRWAEGRHENSRKVQFRPGHTTWNKGVKGSAGLHANCRRTQFRKGHLGGAAAAKVKPVGSLRIADGQLQRKVNNDRPFMRRWVAVSRLVWEAANGPIPAGYIVAFKRGLQTVDESLITIDRLELISRAENMRRNSYHNYPQPIPKLIQLRGALQRQINKRTKA